MRKILCMALACVSILGCLCTRIGAVEVSAADFGEYEMVQMNITRTTGSFSTTIKANGKVAVDEDFSLAAGETVRLRAIHAPENASVDFGLVDQDGIFHYVNVTTGSIDKTIEVPTSGYYTLAIRNNSGTAVKVSGTVRY